MQSPLRWVRLRWVACACAGTTAAALLALPAAAPWLTVLGAAAAAYAVFTACAQWRVGSTWCARRVSGLERLAVLVTGCDRGFGYEAARRLHAAGFGRVFACVLNEESAGAQEFRHLQCPRMRVLPCDVTDMKAVTAAGEEVRQELRRAECELWAVVNNAGVLSVGESEWMQLKDVQITFDVNAMGHVRIIQTFLPLLRKTHGRIVNVNSLASRIAGIFLTPYTMSKFTSLALTASLRTEMTKFSVTVHSIEPWIVKNEMGKAFIPLLRKTLDNVSKELKKEYVEDYPQKAEKLFETVLRFFGMPASNAVLVVDAIEDACLSTCPEDRYVPGNLSKLTDSFQGIVNISQHLLMKYFLK